MDTERAGSSFEGVGAGRGAEESALRRQIDEAIRRFQQGVERETSFQLLFESYYRPLLRFFARKGFGPEASRDLTQETFLGIYRGLNGFRRDARFESWLYRIATTTYLKRVRDASRDKRRGREVAHDDVAETPALSTAPGQLGEVLAEERRRRVRRAVGELPPQMRKCLALRVEQELSYREIAAVLGIEVDTVKAHLFQARQRLRELVHLDPLDRSPE